MPESIWDLIGKISYIISILGVSSQETIKAELEHLQTQLQQTLGTDALYALHRHEDTHGRDWPESVIMGVFTSRFAAAQYLRACDVGMTPDECQMLVDGSTAEFKVGDTDDETSVDVTTYTILPVLNGVDPK